MHDDISFMKSVIPGLTRNPVNSDSSGLLLPAPRFGYHGRNINWYGFMAPKGTPEEVIKTIYTACKKVSEDHKKYIESRLESLSLKHSFLGPEEWANVLKQDNASMKKIYMELSKGGR